ncbi:MAG: bifunctional heptose 7-phosphate kinase/heptose 1-phosphate adenyltransferase [Candidatus Odinarchaeota archaeon]
MKHLKNLFNLPYLNDDSEWAYLDENKEFLDIISTFENKRLLVIGDIIVDRYIIGMVNNVASDAPVPVVIQYSAEDFLGGALNLARCIRGLGGQVCLCSVVGNDDEGKFVRDASLNHWEMDVEGIFTVDNVHTTLNTRVIGNTRGNIQHVLRIDRDIEESVIEDIQKQVEVFLLEHRHEYDAIVIADHDKGFITPEIVEFITKTYDIPIVARPILKHFSYYSDVTAIILHRRTAEKLLQIPMINETSIRNSGLRVLRMLDPQAVLITWIEDGFHLFLRDGEVVYTPSNAKNVIKLVGYRGTTCSDTVTSVFALGLSSKVEMTVCSKLSLKAAEFYVSRASTLPITYEEFSKYLTA